MKNIRQFIKSRNHCWLDEPQEPLTVKERTVIKTILVLLIFSFILVIIIL